ncbi:hypothetical protein [Paenibacillus lautus]|uniref:hypothetical protein n=1 Tax=Paenibacillus lautus TaxID=1401 RepID=UPI001C1164C2|nr:hypothetical protein [Paenibacillus lautus]MBU5350075.1 hypothetical protein [Paenibacillus lautus]
MALTKNDTQAVTWFLQTIRDSLYSLIVDRFVYRMARFLPEGVPDQIQSLAAANFQQIAEFGVTTLTINSFQFQIMDIDADGSNFEANDYERNAYIFYVSVYIEETSGPLYLPYWKRIQTMEGYNGSQS